MQTPDITRVQIVAVVGAILAVAAAFGLPVSVAQQHAILTLATVLAPVLIAADAVIRHGRASNASGVVAAASAAQVAPAAPADATASPAPASPQTATQAATSGAVA